MPSFRCLNPQRRNIFATIVRYSEDNNINNSITLSQIEGVVIIDEVELHLHSNLQRNTLPKLMKLFPKVQFVITTHSPLFLLGLEEVYGANGFEIHEMPNGDCISAEAFSEFQKAYAFYSATKNVYSFTIPVPAHRTDTPKICIEHYYSDNDIKTQVEINGVQRRIYMGNEFDSVGISVDGQLCCVDRNSCGPDKIRIIDGTSDKRVFCIQGDRKTNLALPKMEFADRVLGLSLIHI